MVGVWREVAVAEIPTSCVNDGSGTVDYLHDNQEADQDICAVSQDVPPLSMISQPSNQHADKETYQDKRAWHEYQEIMPGQSDFMQ